MATDAEINTAVARKLGWIKTRGPVGIEVPGIKRSFATYFIRKTNTGKGIGQEMITSIPDYCHSIAAAWVVVEFIEVQYNEYSITVRKLFISTHGKYSARIANAFAIAETAPMAICLAFLKLHE